MKIAGKKGFYRIKNPDRKMSKDGKEIVIEGKWHRIYAEVAPEADDVYIPVVKEGTELDMRRYLGYVSEERAWNIVSGLSMMRFKDLTLKAKVCQMVDLASQKISFLRKDPDKDITKIEDHEQRILPGKFVKHFGRIGLDVRQVYIPIITTEGDRVKIRLDSFVFQEKKKEINND